MVRISIFKDSNLLKVFTVNPDQLMLHIGLWEYSLQRRRHHGAPGCFEHIGVHAPILQHIRHHADLPAFLVHGPASDQIPDIDFAFLQQDGFDPVDSLCPIERQRYMLDLILEICDRKFTFEGYEQCSAYFKRLINTLRQMNYNKWGSEDFEKYRTQLNEILAENGN